MNTQRNATPGGLLSPLQQHGEGGAVCRIQLRDGNLRTIPTVLRPRKELKGLIQLCHPPVPPEETFSIADYGYILAGGKIIAEGTPDALRTSDSELARQFLGGKPDGPVPFHYPAKDDYATALTGVWAAGEAI